MNRSRKSVTRKKKEAELTVIDAQRAMNLIIVMRKLGTKVHSRMPLGVNDFNGVVAVHRVDQWMEK